MLTKAIRISGLVTIIIWGIIGLLLITSGFVFLKQLKTVANSSKTSQSTSSSQPIPASLLNASQTDCLKNNWGEDQFNRYSQDLRQAPLELRKKAVSCLSS